VNLVGAAVVLGLGLWFAWYCLTDLSRAPQVLIFSRQVWAVLIVFTIPIGGLLYLRYGRVR
jgi:hypothetical protein